MITIEHLSKSYGSLAAVDDLSFTVKPGRVTGFLGPNGAGKTTTLRMATNLIHPDRGRVTFGGQPYRQLTKPFTHVGMALEPAVFHPGRTALNHLLMLAPHAGAGRQRCEQVLGLVGLADAAGKRVGKFSLGMRGRLNLAAALLGDPDTLLLDEPVNGLDPEGIRWIRELLRGLAAEGRTILISSHLLSEVQQTVEAVVIIAHGRLVYEGGLAELEGLAGSAVDVRSESPAAVRGLAHAHGWTVREASDPAVVRIEGATPTEIGQAAMTAGIPLAGLTEHGADLESVFFALTEGQGGMR
ncbi:MAG: ATP-binding cassette domain-containing protein [Propionibacteriaceae bacterium]|nr:ATP-binding cassette domain-containing protein [Propionibacteriaceae bacterium]